jgi:TRAP-type C4-dicarboxylate transport system permease small subunit
MFLRLHRLVRAIAYLMAVLGGVVLFAIVLMVCLSILGRTATSILHSGVMQTGAPGLANWLLGTGIGPIRGDYELLETGMAFCIFAFLAWCQVTSGHATVDIFTDGLRPWAKRVLQAVVEVVFAAVLVLVAVQLYDGMLAQQRRRSTTFLLQFPLWWSYMGAVVPAFIAAGVACYMALVRLAEAALNRPLITADAGADH